MSWVGHTLRPSTAQESLSAEDHFIARFVTFVLLVVCMRFPECTSHSFRGTIRAAAEEDRQTRTLR